ncbi:penicillin binding protein PBP4B [Priestia filamentosa]|uniref:penicillin binding protein PBP4B n=1 Tax=Priestia filamentosa TaxID=1402861 RepID=UPI000E7200B6|nr:penicillin binding protein PBP4B [Priestia filamentosa]RJS64900.1 penicillin binding protein PBP4B [Priestia filamentosa]
MENLIKKDVEKGFPGGSLLVKKKGKEIYRETCGYQQKYEKKQLLSHPPKLKNQTLFDLASNTKMYATNFALQKLVTEGELNLLSPLSFYFPSFKENVRIIDLLQHTAGFPADFPYYIREKAGDLYSRDRLTTIEHILQTPLSYEPHTQHLYSDLDYMLLGALVEKLTCQTLDLFVEKKIFQKLGLTRTLFNPLRKGYVRSDFAATERMGNTRDGFIHFPNVRTHTLQGEVHDEKAFYSMDGVSGHAGLFSTVDELSVLVEIMHHNGSYGTKQVFSESTAKTFVTPSQQNPSYGLGWRLNNGDMKYMFGEHASSSAFGHTGWTGTLTIIDPAHELTVVLLTNKKHSPLKDPLKSLNIFEGDEFKTGQYGPLVTELYKNLL